MRSEWKRTEVDTHFLVPWIRINHRRRMLYGGRWGIRFGVFDRLQSLLCQIDVKAAETSQKQQTKFPHHPIYPRKRNAQVKRGMIEWAKSTSRPCCILDPIFCRTVLFGPRVCTVWRRKAHRWYGSEYSLPSFSLSKDSSTSLFTVARISCLFEAIFRTNTPGFKRSLWFSSPEAMIRYLLNGASQVPTNDCSSLFQLAIAGFL